MIDSRTIAICIATFRRPHLLRNLLAGIDRLRIPLGVKAEVRIVDNDESESGRAVVNRWAEYTRFSVRYGVESRRNIAAARNRALDMGRADLFAFIDDDEVPDVEWLAALLRAIDDGGHAAAFGVVVPSLPRNAPAWIIRGKFFHKPVHDGLSATSWNGARTANALVDGAWIHDRGLRFREEFGQTGGEDTELFSRLVQMGATLTWTRDALVHETIDSSQCSLRYLLRRYRRSGRVYERLAPSRRPWRRASLRLASSTTQLLVSFPLAAIGFHSSVITPLLRIATAIGGIEQAKLWIESNQPGYDSAGCH